MLHITNGDSTATTLHASNLGGDVLAWRDVLHEGPVPAGLALADLSAVRARYLADEQTGDAFDAVLAAFQARDAALEASAQHDEVILWFEHDLYDQLHLLQLLDWFAAHDLGTTRLSLICIGAFPGKPQFGGLGELNASELASLFPTRHTVTGDELALGQAAWAAFRAPDPTALEALTNGDLSALPFLAAALTRHLEEFPSTANGLSRTERQLLTVIAPGSETPRPIFAAWQAQEQTRFMGDTTLWARLRPLSTAPHPLVTLTDGGTFRLPWDCATPDDFAAQHLALTDAGRAVLANQADHLTLNGINRWLGGVHLQAGSPLWRWRPAMPHLVQS